MWFPGSLLLSSLWWSPVVGYRPPLGRALRYAQPYTANKPKTPTPTSAHIKFNKFATSSTILSTATHTAPSTERPPSPHTEDDPAEFAHLGLGLRYFREYANRGLRRFTQGNVQGALSDFKRAAASNSSQPLLQLGVVLYCLGDFAAAEEQLHSDIQKLEAVKTFKACDMRLWRSASLNKLGRPAEALNALDVANSLGLDLSAQGYFMNTTLGFFAHSAPMEHMRDMIEQCEERDPNGRAYFGSFYVGLYLDSVGQAQLAESFLRIPATSHRYDDSDMWHHVPRVLYANRFGDIVSRSGDDESGVD